MSSYDRFALFYHWEHQNFTQDIVLYQQFAQRCDAPVLDVGCGSGRVTLSLAQAGVEVVGIDPSAALLDLARAQVDVLGVGQRVHLLLGDVTEYDVPPQFAMALFALNGFLHLPTVAAQQMALRRLSQALLPGGFLLIDLPNPHVTFDPAQDGVWLERSRFVSPQGQPITCWQHTETDLAAQVQRLTLYYDRLVDEQGQIDRTVVEMPLRFVYRYEMEHLMTAAGLVVDAVYGTYDLDPYEADSSHMFFVAYKPL